VQRFRIGGGKLTSLRLVNDTTLYDDRSIAPFVVGVRQRSFVRLNETRVVSQRLTASSEGDVRLWDATAARALAHWRTAAVGV
jgi:hypothetical protein